MECPICRQALEGGELVMVCGACHRSLPGGSSGLHVHATGEFRIPTPEMLESLDQCVVQCGFSAWTRVQERRHQDERRNLKCHTPRLRGGGRIRQARVGYAVCRQRPHDYGRTRTIIGIPPRGRKVMRCCGTT